MAMSKDIELSVTGPHTDLTPSAITLRRNLDFDGVAEYVGIVFETEAGESVVTLSVPSGAALANALASICGNPGGRDN
jgi:hypothetical protein